MSTTLRKSYGRILTSKTKDLGYGVVEVIVSTNAKDRHGERLDIKGLNTKNFSGAVFLNHNYEQLPIGKSISLKKQADGKLISKTQFAVDEFDVAATVYKLVKGGYMPDVSIGFIPQEYDSDTDTWTKSEMIEYSHVGIGANPEAKVIKGLEKNGMDMDEFKAQVKDYFAQVKSLEDSTAPELPENDDADPPEENPIVVTSTGTTATAGYVSSTGGTSYTTTTPLWTTTTTEGIYTHSLPVDKPEPLSDNVINHLKALQPLISAAVEELETSAKDTDNSPESVKQKRIVLVRAKKTVQTVDRIAELALNKLSNKLKEQNNE